MDFMMYVLKYTDVKNQSFTYCVHIYNLTKRKITTTKKTQILFTTYNLSKLSFLLTDNFPDTE